MNTKWITDISIEAIEKKVNDFGQTKGVVVRYTQTNMAIINNNVVYLAVIFYEN